jgi:cap2 methyltransferase
MQELKENTNVVRDMLDTKHIGIWHKLTSFTNLTGDVVYALKRQFSPELCTVAWAKMYESLYRFRLLEQHGPVRSAHICEAPGGFIAATNHYLRQLHGDHLDWTWVGVTLNPYFEDNDNEAMVEDDQVRVALAHTWRRPGFWA